MNSIELIDQQSNPSGETSDYIISGDANDSEAANEETKEQPGRNYKVVRSLLLILKIIFDSVIFTRVMTDMSREYDSCAVAVIKLISVSF